MRAVVDRGFTHESSRGRHLLREFPLSVTLSKDCFAKENCAPDDDFVARNDDSERSATETLNLMTLSEEFTL